MTSEKQIVKKRRSKKLRKIDVEVLEGLARFNPRNITKLAPNVGMPRETLRYRIRYLRSHFSMVMQGNLYHTNLGLRKVFIFAKAKPGYEDNVYEGLKSSDYWLNLSQCFGSPECIATYAVPSGYEEVFDNFADTLRKSNIVSNVDVAWSTSTQSVNATRKWYDADSEQWIFPWKSWVEELPTAKTDLPYTLKESQSHPQKADWIDIMILKELEKNCTIKLKDIARQLNMSLQRIKYHYGNHVLGKKMFEGPQILADHFQGLNADTYYFRFSFPNYEKLSKFANSLLEKPFVRTVGKTYGKNELGVQIYLPRAELMSFLDSLAKLVKTGFVDTYDYFIQDLARTHRRTIPYEHFKGRSWVYDYEGYLQKLNNTLTKPV